MEQKQYKLVDNGQELIINYLMEKDSGKYSCVAENRFGQIKRSQKFVVQGIFDII